MEWAAARAGVVPEVLGPPLKRWIEFASVPGPPLKRRIESTPKGDYAGDYV